MNPVNGTVPRPTRSPNAHRKSRPKRRQEQDRPPNAHGKKSSRASSSDCDHYNERSKRPRHHHNNTRSLPDNLRRQEQDRPPNAHVKSRGDSSGDSRPASYGNQGGYNSNSRWQESTGSQSPPDNSSIINQFKQGKKEVQDVLKVTTNYIKRAVLDHALVLLKNVKDAGIKPDNFIYNTTIFACGNSKSHEGMRQALYPFKRNESKWNYTRYLYLQLCYFCL